MGVLTVAPLRLAGAFAVTTKAFTDERGQFARLFAADELAEVLQGRTLAHLNGSFSITAGTIRGLHMQTAPHTEQKFVRCLKGKAYDVMVDLRQGSPTFMQWEGLELSPEALNMVVVPPGVAHGFQTLELETLMLYATTHSYTPAAEFAVNPLDPAFKIGWPLPPTVMAPADAERPPLPAGFNGFEI